jgi:MtaA/CmuA family methyltransferase
MNGKERVCAAFKCRETDRVPWVPFVGCHAGSLIGKNASEYLLSADHMFAGISRAVELYRPDGIPVAFDLQIEAEILGCGLVWSEQNPPAVTSHPLAAGKKVPDLVVPAAGQGRFPVVLETARRLRAAYPDIALYGLVTGPFTLAMHLGGTDLFMQMLTDPQYVHSVMHFCEQAGTAVAGYYLDAGCDVIAVVDPMTSQIGAGQFEEFVSRYARSIFNRVRKRNALSSFFVCGFAQQNIEVMCACGPDNVSIDENIPLDYVRDICLKQGISFGGNLQLTVVLLNGSRADVARNALACMELGGRRGFLLAPGCDLPYATPPENLRTVLQLVEDPYSTEMVQLLERGAPEQETLDMDDYGKTDRVIVDIITLDSEACAPCQYMVEAVKKITPQFEGIVLWREHKIKNREAVTFMSSLMVKNIPTICIDGKITFVSKIPPRDELIAAIQRRINEKLRLRIRSRRGEITLFGPQDDALKTLRETVQRACRELGADIPLRCCDDPVQTAEFGILRTPALVTTRHSVKCEGEAPSVEVVKEWIKGIA